MCGLKNLNCVFVCPVFAALVPGVLLLSSAFLGVGWALAALWRHYWVPQQQKVSTVLAHQRPCKPNKATASSAYNDCCQALHHVMCPSLRVSHTSCANSTNHPPPPLPRQAALAAGAAGGDITKGQDLIVPLAQSAALPAEARAWLACAQQGLWPALWRPLTEYKEELQVSMCFGEDQAEIVL